jgi:hypothetical protein
MNQGKHFLTFEEEHVELTEKYLARSLADAPGILGEQIRQEINRITGRVD